MHAQRQAFKEMISTCNPDLPRLSVYGPSWVPRPGAGGGKVREQPGQSPCTGTGGFCDWRGLGGSISSCCQPVPRELQAASRAKFILNQTGLLVGLFAEGRGEPGEGRIVLLSLLAGPQVLETSVSQELSSTQAPPCSKSSTDPSI